MMAEGGIRLALWALVWIRGVSFERASFCSGCEKIYKRAGEARYLVVLYCFWRFIYGTQEEAHEKVTQ